MIEERIEAYKRDISKCETVILIETFGRLAHNFYIDSKWNDVQIKMDIIIEEILKRTGERK
jgi:hypothetical protein